MNTSPEQLVEALRAALLENSGLEQRLADLRAAASEPVAITGMACRYPGGANSPEALWQLVRSGTDAIDEFPENRGWRRDDYYDPDDPAKSAVSRGGFLPDAPEFDPAPFGIPPREAVAMDPQQRILLEIAWEALERSGRDPLSLRGSRTGVFIGAANSHYLNAATDIPAELAQYLITGGVTSVASGRIAYTLGLRGPALTLDTACSSALVALHTAVTSLRRGDCSLALVGGAMVLPSPMGLASFRHLGALAPDGRCKAFAKGADGLGLAEGAGMLAVQRLSDARREGRPVLAVIRGLAVNQDGASNGLTAPSAQAQREVIEAALADARVAPGEVDLLEAHGTGTQLGDPMEVRALQAVYGAQRRPDDAPLWLGSVKSNIGHSQMAAGLAGVIKAVMAMRHRILPRTLHVDEPSPHIDWDAGNVRLLTEERPWRKPGAGERRAAVSAFGISGTNAHVILAEGDPVAAPAKGADTLPAALPWTLAAHGETALRRQARRLLAHVEARPGLGLADVGHSLATTRAALPRRAVIVAGNRAGFLDGLRALAEGRPAPGVTEGSVLRDDSRPVFVFPGQGAQWLGMATELYDASPLFAGHLDACAEAVDALVDWRLLEVLRGAPDAPPLDRIDVVQPALFAVMVALARLWQSYGIAPAAVLGHSQGEAAAAHIAGALSLKDAARVVTVRARLLHRRLTGQGGMVSVDLPRPEAERRIADWAGRMSVAVVNGPGTTVVSGEREAAEEFFAVCQAEGLRARQLKTDVAGHSAQMEQVRDELLAELRVLRPGRCSLPFYSARAGGLIDAGTTLDAEFWYSVLREPVLYHQAVDAALGQGHAVFIETSVHPVLGPATLETAEFAGRPAAVIGSLRRGDGGLDRLLTSLGEAWIAGVRPAWDTVYGGLGVREVELPTYAFHRQRFWLGRARRSAEPSALGLETAAHPVLGAVFAAADEERTTFTGVLHGRPEAEPWLGDRKVGGRATAPAALFAELALAAADKVGCGRIAELIVTSPLPVPLGGVRLQLTVGPPDTDGLRRFTVYARPQREPQPGPDGGATDTTEWTAHAHGVLAPAAGAEPQTSEDWPPGDAEPLDVPVPDAAPEAPEVGDAPHVSYGPAARTLRALWRRTTDGRTELFAEAEVSGEARTPDAAGAERFGLHPALLDAALQAVSAVSSADGGSDPLPAVADAGHWRDVTLHGSHATSVRLHLTLKRTGPDTEFSLRADDALGQPVLTARSVRTAAAGAPEHTTTRSVRRDSLFRVGWTPLPYDEASRPGSWGVLGEGLDELTALGARALPDLAALTGALDGGEPVPELVLTTLTRPPLQEKPDDAHATSTAAASALALLQGWLADSRLADSTLVLVTHGAVAARPGQDTVPDLAGGALWGMLRSAQSEHPGRVRLLDLGDEPSRNVTGTLWSALASGEPQVAVRGNGVYVPRLVRAGLRPSSGAEGPLDPAGTVLITGGTGTLGRLVARHLVTHHGIRRLVLTGRRGAAAPGAAGLVAELNGLGAEATVAACDVADRDQLRRLLGSIPAAHPLTGVVHAAGVLDDGVLESLTQERLERVLRPKVRGALNLHELTVSLDLDAFVVFSGGAGLFGNPGQANYAAANAFLDALAARRRATGRAGLSLAWGLWAEASGMREGFSHTDLARMVRAGALPLRTEEALTLFDACLSAASGPGAADNALLVPVHLNLESLRTEHTPGTVSALLRGLAPSAVGRAAGSEGGGDSEQFVRRLARLPRAQRHRRLLDLVRRTACAVLRHDDPGSLAPHGAFKDLGFDSLTAVELRNRLNQATGLRLPPTLVFDHPTPSALSARLVTELFGDQAAERKAVEPARPGAAADEDDPVVIVGMSCRLPGADSPERLWRLLADGTESIGPLPADRGWDASDLEAEAARIPGLRVLREGGFLREASAFDAELFGITPEEALVMDPQQRILLELAWEALEDARIAPDSLRGRRVGVYMGAFHQPYVTADSAVPESSGPHLGSSIGALFTSGRIAYALGLEGPAFTTDTGCSSSAVALHLACQAVRDGECRVALAGGVTVLAKPFVLPEGAGAAPDGRCRAFAEEADGTGWGEGGGLVVVERLSDARRHGHEVLAVVRGSAQNNDGASNGLHAPNGPSQERLIRHALADAGLAPGDVDAVEAHGTGTSLGDAIEAGALQAVYGAGRPDDRPVWLGSVKSNIGHPHAASGIAGVIKTVLALRHGLLPRTLHADRPTSRVDWGNGGVRLLTRARPWPRSTRPRRAGVSSIGVIGTKVHLILEEPPASDGPSRPTERGEETPERGEGTTERTTVGAAFDGLLPFVLSARSDAALRAQAERLRTRVARAPAGEHLADLAFSLATTRAQLDTRAVILAADRTELLDRLDALAQGSAVPGVITGSGTPNALTLHVPDLTSDSTDGTYGRERSPGDLLDLYDTMPRYAEAWDKAAAPMTPLLDGRALREALRSGPHPDGVAETETVTRCAHFTTVVALGRLFTEWGITPDTVTGDGLGDLAAAHLRGDLPLPEAAALLAAPGTTPRRPAAPPQPAADATTLTLSPAGAAAPSTVWTALAHAYAAGATPDWQSVYADSGAHSVPLPHYAFQRSSYWLT